MVVTSGNGTSRLTSEQESEIASVKRDLPTALNSYSQYFLRSQDQSILARGKGKKLVEIFREVESDPRIYAALTQRFGAAIGREVVVEAASDRRNDKKAADEVRKQINSLNKYKAQTSNSKAAVYSNGAFESATLTFLDAIFVGYSVAEIDWASEGGNVYVRQIWARDQSRFTFNVADGGHELRLLTNDSLFDGVALPPRKFLVTTYGSKDGNPLGEGLASKLFWLSWIKKEIQKFWLIFCDKYGSPTLKGTYQTDRQRDKLLEIMRNVAQQAGVALPEGVNLEILQASGSSTQTYETFCGYIDTQSVEAILLQNLTTNITGGSYAASSTHLEIREELVDGDCALLTDGPYRDLSTWICAFNYPDAEPPLIYRPRLKIPDEARARRDTALVSLVGRPLTDSYLKTFYDCSFLTEEELAKKQKEQQAQEQAAALEPEQQNNESPFEFAEGVDPLAMVNKLASNGASAEELETMVDLLLKSNSNAS